MIEAESGLDTKKIAPYPPIAGTHPAPYKSFGLFQVINLSQQVNLHLLALQFVNFWYRLTAKIIAVLDTLAENVKFDAKVHLFFKFQMFSIFNTINIDISFLDFFYW